MLSVPMRSAKPLNRQTILSLNRQTPLIPGAAAPSDRPAARNASRSEEPLFSGSAAQPTRSAAWNAPRTEEPLFSGSAAQPTRSAARNAPRTEEPLFSGSAAQSTRSAARNAARSEEPLFSGSAVPPVTKMSVPALRNPLRKGQKAALSPDGNLSRIQAKLGWNIKNAACDTDVSAFLLNSSGKVIGDSWFVFYGQDTSPDGSTRFAVDQGTDREVISIDFTKLNPGVSKIVFVLTIHEALERHLNFSMLEDAYIRIMDQTSGRELVSFMMTDYYSNVTSMMIGELYKHNGIWKFNAIGNGVARDLAGLCELYGVEVV